MAWSRSAALGRLKDLKVHLLADVQQQNPPSAKGQAVVVLYGEYAHCQGVTMQQTGVKWQVWLFSKQKAAFIDTAHLHAKVAAATDGDGTSTLQQVCSWSQC